jgi:hypothetical protein
MAYFGEIRCDQTGEVLESTDGKIKHPYITIRGSVAVQRYGEDGQRWLDFLTSGPSDRLVFKDPQSAADWFKTQMEVRERGEVPVRRPRSFDPSNPPRPRRPYGAGAGGYRGGAVSDGGSSDQETRTWRETDEGGGRTY